MLLVLWVKILLNIRIQKIDEANAKVMKKIVVAGFQIVPLGRSEFAELMVTDWLAQREHGYELRPKVSYSVNGQIIAEVNRSDKLKDIFDRADYLDADGMCVVFASKLLCSRKLAERVATTDFFHDAARTAERKGLSFFFLGSTEENNRAACERLKKKYPRLTIVGAHHGYFDASKEGEIAEMIAQAKPDVVWIAMGYPRQEILADKLRMHLRGVTWIKTCGGLLEHILELHPRAPLFIQRIGFEWLYRLMQEPRRLGARYLGTNPLALWYLLTKTEQDS